MNLDDDDGTGSVVPGTPMDVDESRAGSPSAMSAQVGGRKGKGKKGLGISETLEPDGGLPGAKDGLGAFPPGSEWAELMLALKLKGACRVLAHDRGLHGTCRKTLPDEEGTDADGKGRSSPRRGRQLGLSRK